LLGTLYREIPDMALAGSPIWHCGRELHDPEYKGTSKLWETSMSSRTYYPGGQGAVRRKKVDDKHNTGRKRGDEPITLYSQMRIYSEKTWPDNLLGMGNQGSIPWKKKK